MFYLNLIKVYIVFKVFYGIFYMLNIFENGGNLGKEI